MDNYRKERKYTIEDLEEFLDNIPYQVWIKDKEGRHKYANKLLAEKMNLKKEDIIGKTDYDFRPPEMAESCVKGDKSVLSTGKSSFVEDEILVGDETQWFEIYKTLLYKEDEDKELLAGIARYSSNKKISKQESIIESCLDAANSYKDNNNEMEYKILEGLKQIIRADDVALYSYNRETSMMELKIHIGKNKVIFVRKSQFSNKDQAYFDNGVITEYLGNNSIRYIYLIKSKNKPQGLLDIYFKNKPEYLQEDIIKYIYLILSFIQENRELGVNLKRELARKKDAQKQLEMIVNTVIDIYAIVEKNAGNLKFMRINKKCSKILGWTCEEINEKGILYFVHKDDKVRAESFIKGNFIEMQDVIFKILCKDGTWKIVSLNWSCIKNNMFIITAKDMTKINELKKVKENLEETIELKRLKTEFFANLSHEFKTPLNIILSVVQIMENSGNSSLYNNFNRYVKSIKQNSYRLLKLANNMIDLSKIDDGFYDMSMNNYNIVEVVENVVQSVAEYMKNNKRNIIFDTSEEEIITACAPNEIEKIILNLLSNSLKFTSANGNIFVNIDVSYDCSKVLIRVKNDGPALNKEDAEKIFERFTQSENLLTRSVEGSGIGLALVKSLVEMHNGRIYANTEITDGTEFCIEIPIRRIINRNYENVFEKSLNSKVEKFNIEFSDIYDLN